MDEVSDESLERSWIAEDGKDVEKVYSLRVIVLSGETEPES